MSRKNSIGKILAVITVIATFGALLGWGLIAQSWTQLTTTNNPRLAIETAKRSLYTIQYSLPLGSQWRYQLNASFVGGSCSSGPASAMCSLTPPVSNSSTTIEDYMTFDLSVPNGTAIKVWNTGPLGNVTSNCGGSLYSSCSFGPNEPGIINGLVSFYSVVQTPGNYTLHILSVQCSASQPPYSGNCPNNTATGTVSIGVSTIEYNRPYWAWGLATEVGGTVGIISTIIVGGIIAYRGQKQRSTLHPPSKGRPQGQVVD